MKIAAVQMQADLGNVAANLEKAEKIAKDAFQAGAEWVILPEFFTSAAGFSPKMQHAALPFQGAAMELLTSLSKKYQGAIGGSYIAWKDGDAYNTFVLALPDGTVYQHDKDLPTMWENCYYIGGSDTGVLHLPNHRVGAALCWEFVRSMTARRLRNRVDLVVGGSCWWTLPEKRLPGLPKSLHDRNYAIMKETIPRFARMLGVPVVHAAHAGNFEGRLPMVPGFLYKSYFLGETQIVDGSGKQLARMDCTAGDGYVTADLDLTQKVPVSEAVPDRFWIPELPWQFRLIWAYQNWHGRRYYRRKMRLIDEKRFGDSGSK